ncbi:MAG: hypothetical protein JRH20_27160, partial [Deltaproteobacteria bacterium]|nr:hypothetical protein [Deltaproteobacteria bacterium]
ADNTWGSCTPNVAVGAQLENCSVAGDEDCDGAADGADTDCCVNGTTQTCDAGNAFCMGTETCANNIWGNCTLLTPAETTPDNDCDGVDNDCNGIADDGTFLKGPTLLVEYLPASVTQRLIGHNGEAFLYGRIGNGSVNDRDIGRWVIWDAWPVAPAPAKMLAVGDRLEVLLNKLTNSGTYFSANDLLNASAMMISTPNFPNSSCSGDKGCFIVFVGSTAKMVNLTTGATSTLNLSAFPWGDPPATTPPTSVKAATSFPENSFKVADGSDTDPVVLLIDGNRCWFWSPNGNPLTETTTTNCFCHVSGVDQNCPSEATLKSLDAITYFRGGDDTDNIGLAQGAYHYSSEMLEATTTWAISYKWNEPLPISAYACDHPPR